MRQKPQWRYNDGGRVQAGHKGLSKSSIPRACAIALNKSYEDVYIALMRHNIHYITVWHNEISRLLIKRGPDPEKGVPIPIYSKYLLQYGWIWKSLPSCILKDVDTTYLKENKIVSKIIIIKAGNILTVMKKGVFYDVTNPIHNCPLERKVKGYYIKKY